MLRSASEPSRGRFVAALIVLSLLAGLTLATPAQPARANTTSPGICVGKSDQAHPSTGASKLYVIVKGRFTCGPNVAWAQFTETLMFCTNKPPSGTANGCSPVGDPGTDTEAPPVAGREYTVYGPPEGRGGVAEGWYVGRALWAWSGSAGYLVGTHTSAAMYCKRVGLVMACQTYKF